MYLCLCSMCISMNHNKLSLLVIVGVARVQLDSQGWGGTSITRFISLGWHIVGVAPVQLDSHGFGGTSITGFTWLGWYIVGLVGLYGLCVAYMAYGLV